jgi:hypothetical protein
MRETDSRTALFAMLLFLPMIATAQSPCLPADSISERVQIQLVALATSPDSQAVNARGNVNLPSLDSSDVRFVTDSATCAGVANALAAITPGGDPNPAAWVFQLGPTRYVAYNFRRKFHGSGTIYVFDQNFLKLSSWMF